MTPRSRFDADPGAEATMEALRRRYQPPPPRSHFGCKVTLIAVKRRGKGEFKINIDDLCEAFHCSRTARLTKIEEKPSLVASQAAPL
jgi:hypothetical protein